jgi:hypothetical protein
MPPMLVAVEHGREGPTVQVALPIRRPRLSPTQTRCAVTSRHNHWVHAVDKRVEVSPETCLCPQGAIRVQIGRCWLWGVQLSPRKAFSPIAMAERPKIACGSRLPRSPNIANNSPIHERSRRTPVAAAGQGRESARLLPTNYDAVEQDGHGI